MSLQQDGQERQQNASNNAQEQGCKKVLLSFFQCFLGCFLGILFLPIFFAFGIAYVVILWFLLGPLYYYQATIFNSNALSNKYVAEGVPFQASVVKRWKTGEGSEGGTTFHVQVAYNVTMNDVQQPERYVSHLIDVPPQEYENETMNLVRLPEYPTSAVLSSAIQGADPEFPPSTAASVFFSFTFTILSTLTPIAIGLAAVESCAFCTALIAPVFVSVIVLEFVVGYFVALRNRDSNLQSTLYRAEQDSTNDSDEVAPTLVPPRVSYGEMFNEKNPSFLTVVRNIVCDLGRCLLWIVTFAYLFVFGGGYVCMSCSVIARWRQQLLATYQDTGVSITGSVVCRQDKFAIVLYQVNDEDTFYKARLLPPRRLLPDNGGCGKHVEYDDIPDDQVELLYLPNLATSAMLKSRVENRSEAMKVSNMHVFVGVNCAAWQVAFVTCIVVIIIPRNETSFYVLAAGVYVALQVVFGFAGAVLYYYMISRRQLLYGAKKVAARWNETFTTHTMDEEMNVGETLEVVDEKMNVEGAVDDTAMQANDKADTFVDDFMSGKFPRLDKAFS